MTYRINEGERYLINVKYLDAPFVNSYDNPENEPIAPGSKGLLPTYTDLRRSIVSCRLIEAGTSDQADRDVQAYDTCFAAATCFGQVSALKRRSPVEIAELDAVYGVGPNDLSPPIGDILYRAAGIEGSLTRHGVTKAVRGLGL